MKAIIDTLSSEATYRLKSPLIGSFIFSWGVVNYKFLMTFILSDNSVRLNLINDLPIGWVNGIVYPTVFTIAFMFFVPFFQWRLDIAKYKLIDKRRTDTLNIQLLERYHGQSVVAKEKNRTTPEYWSELHRNHSENAGKKIIDLKAEISRYSELVREKENLLAIENSNYEKLRKSDQVNGQQLQDTKQKLGELNDQIGSIKEKYYRCKKVIDDALMEIEDSDDALPEHYFNSEYEGVVTRMHDLLKPLFNDAKINQNQYFQKELLALMHDQDAELDSTFKALKERVDRSSNAYERAVKIMAAHRSRKIDVVDSTTSLS